MSVTRLRRHALSLSLFPPTTLAKAIDRLGFVQADPIRSPARAQDLILRLRVRNYRAGDLEKHYPDLDLEEDLLYAYGFMPRSTWQLLHPRFEKQLTPAEQRVIDIFANQKRIHPRDLRAELGNDREVNAWGGYSKATTRILQALHYRGLLRVAGRERGIRLYELAAQDTAPSDRAERLRKIVLLIARILAPLPERSLREALAHLAHSAPTLDGRKLAVPALIESGELAAELVDGVRYLWPADAPPAPRTISSAVRFLAPFDPVVWDRRRFEHLWGWRYRFEAYTPAAKRKLGYYAMPLLWRDDVIGWVNISRRGVKAGFAKEKPNDPAFSTAFDAEVERLRTFLGRPHRS